MSLFVMVDSLDIFHTSTIIIVIFCYTYDEKKKNLDLFLLKDHLYNMDI